jgi:hypothetical protein
MTDLCRFLQKRMEGNKETTNLRELAYVRCGRFFLLACSLKLIYYGF